MSADERGGREAVRGMVQCTGGGLLGWAVKINGREVYSSTDHEDCEAVTRIFRDALDEALAAHLARRRDAPAGERAHIELIVRHYLDDLAAENQCRECAQSDGTCVGHQDARNDHLRDLASALARLDRAAHRAALTDRRAASGDEWNAAIEAAANVVDDVGRNRFVDRNLPRDIANRIRALQRPAPAPTSGAGEPGDAAARLRDGRGDYWQVQRCPSCDDHGGHGREWSVWAGGAAGVRVAHGLYQHEALTIAKHVNTLREVMDEAAAALPQDAGERVGVEASHVYCCSCLLNQPPGADTTDPACRELRRLLG